MTNRSQTVLCDTDFLIALHLENDSTHLRAKEIFSNYSYFVVLDITFWEIATVLSRKLNQDQAILTLEFIQKNFSNVIKFQPAHEVQVFQLYKSYSKKNISFFDCACLVYATQNNYQIASFDQFYPKDTLCQ